jgi:hypothetical protein
MLARQEKSIRLSADQIRANIFRYKSDSYEHQKIRHQFFLTMLNMFLSTNESFIFCEVPRSLLGSLDSFIVLAQVNYLFEVHVVLLDAPDDTLVSRFRARVKESSEKGFSLAVDREDLFIHNRDETRGIIRLFLKQETVIEKSVYLFNTEKDSLEVIFSFVMEKLSL